MVTKTCQEHLQKVYIQVTDKNKLLIMYNRTGIANIYRMVLQLEKEKENSQKKIKTDNNIHRDYQ